MMMRATYCLVESLRYSQDFGNIVVLCDMILPLHFVHMYLLFKSRIYTVYKGYKLLQSIMLSELFMYYVHKCAVEK